MKKWFFTDIEAATLQNNNFRKVLYTGEHTQLVLMTLQPGEDIGEEVHTWTDQFFRFESGTGKCIINETEYSLDAGTAIIVPSWAKHNIINTSNSEVLQMYTLYSPAHHKDWIVRWTKSEAEADAPEFDGKTTE
jgi:mannose-6-phosphate isomerase-like protein (cupin superfamily)